MNINNLYKQIFTRAGPLQPILLGDLQRKVESECGYCSFMVGVLSSVDTDIDGRTPARLLSLMYGSNTIDGRYIMSRISLLHYNRI